MSACFSQCWPLDFRFTDCWIFCHGVRETGIGEQYKRLGRWKVNICPRKWYRRQGQGGARRGEGIQMQSCRFDHFNNTDACMCHCLRRANHKVELKEIELPDNHPWATKQKVTSCVCVQCIELSKAKGVTLRYISTYRRPPLSSRLIISFDPCVNLLRESEINNIRGCVN